MFRWDIQPPTVALLAAQRAAPSSTSSATTTSCSTPRGRRLIDRIETQDPARRNVTICKRRVPAVAGARSLPRQPERAAPEVLRDRHRRRAVLHHHLGQPRGPPVPPVQLLLKIDDPGLWPSFGSTYFTRLLRPEPAAAAAAGGTTDASLRVGLRHRGRLPAAERPAALHPARPLLHRGEPATCRPCSPSSSAPTSARSWRGSSDPRLPGARADLRATRSRTGCRPTCPMVASPDAAVRTTSDPRQDARGAREVPRRARRGSSSPAPRTPRAAACSTTTR